MRRAVGPGSGAEKGARADCENRSLRPRGSVRPTGETERGLRRCIFLNHFPLGRWRACRLKATASW